MSKKGAPIYAVIGVRRNGPSTYYVKRSAFMANYPSVWSLMSIQHAPNEMLDPYDLYEASVYFERMSEQRLGGAALRVSRYLTAGASDANPMNVDVTLKLYELEFDEEPRLNPRYYEAARWMSAAGYEAASAGQRCGLCLRLWSDYAWMAGYTDRPFVPTPARGGGAHAS
jgi:hypothetical protein